MRFLKQAFGWSILLNIFKLKKIDLFFYAFFTDAHHGWVVGMNGKILKTTDGGGYWAPCMNPVSYTNLTSLFFVDDSTGWAVGLRGTIIKTTDAGDIPASDASDTFILIVTSLSGIELSITLNCALPPDSVVTSPARGEIANPTVSLSIFVTFTFGGSIS